MKLILASGSPRRQELLKQMGLRFTVQVCHEPEMMPENTSPEEVVSALALQKARAVQRAHPQDCIIGADTIVYLNGEILGKPGNTEIAHDYLQKLQGNQHRVYTGVAVLTPVCTNVQVCVTEVTFSPMTGAEIDWYVKTGEPMDKAGAYGVQGPGGVFVSQIHGNYFNVMGMPIPLLYEMLDDAGAFQGNCIFIHE